MNDFTQFLLTHGGPVLFAVVLVDQAGVPKLRAIRDRYLNAEKPPASTLVVVTRLARPGCA